MRGCCQCGLTLVELLVAIMLAVVAVATTAPDFTELLRRRRAEGLAAEVAADLQFVRSEAVARNRSIRVTFEQAGDLTCYVIHVGSIGSCTCLAGAHAHCSSGASEIKTQFFPGGHEPGVRANVGSIVYDPVFGTVSPTTTIRIGWSDRPAVHHVINIMGRVRTCAPPGGLRGYPSC